MNIEMLKKAMQITGSLDVHLTFGCVPFPEAKQPECFIETIWPTNGGYKTCKCYFRYESLDRISESLMILEWETHLKNSIQDAQKNEPTPARRSN